MGSQRHDWSERAERLLRAALPAARDESERRLLWAAAPTMLLAARWTIAESVEASIRGRFGHVGRTVAARFTRRRGARVLAQGRSLFVFHAGAQAHTVEPVLGTRQAGWRELDQPSSSRALGRYLRAAARLSTRLTAQLEAEAQFVPDEFVGSLFASARALSRAEGVLATQDPSLVIVASQHATTSRAYILEARSRGIPSFYIPHAPVAHSIIYDDLPTDHVGLRGPGEVEYYGSIGVDVERLRVVGNPGADVIPVPEISASLPPVFAPSPVPHAEVEALAALVHDEIGDDVIVAPHPRMGPSSGYRECWPDTWAVHGGRTIELLQRGHPVVLQASSGVAWEALAHGIPVVQLSADGRDVNYPFIREPHVLMVRARTDLRPAFEAARARGESSAERDRLRAWAAHWSAFSGPEAVSATIALIQELEGSEPLGPVHDCWMPSGLV